MSSTLIERIVREARTAFFQGITDPDLDNLVWFVDQLRASSVNLDNSLLRISDQIRRTSACYYIDVFSSETFSISISILNPGVNFPLHDTPGMYGIVKVIKGCVNISTYTAVADDYANIAVPKDVRARVNRSQKNNAVCIPVNKHETKMGVRNQPCILRPQQGNFHEICAIGYEAAFIKILAPPYDMVNRTYTFYKALQTAEEDAVIQNWLVKSRPDSMFFSYTLPYCGPQIRL